MGIYVVTGGTTGIGAEVCRMLMGEGHEVFNIDYKDGDFQADLSTDEGVNDAIQAVKKKYPDGIDGLISNAGVGPTAPAEKIFALNFYAGTYIAEGLRPLLIKKKGCCVMTCSNTITNSIVRMDWVELLTNLWIKTLTINKVRSQAHTFSSAGSPMYQNVTVGGQTADGKDAVNRLSFLVLKSVGQTRLPQPNLTVRYHKNLNQAFLDEAIEVLKLGTGMPAFNNDEVIIPSFIEKGVKKEDAYCYSAIGCVETAVPGKWGYRCTGMSYLNFPRILLMVMNNGIDVTSGRRFVKDYGNFRDMETFDDLMKAWDGAIRELTRASVIVENAIDLASEREVPDVLCSCLTQDCLGRGRTIKEGGAVYDFISGLQVGIANMADSLSAVYQLA